jgi:hypothetical protein
LVIGRRVDLATKPGLKPWIRPHVLKDARVIYAACAVVPEKTVFHHLTVIGEAISRLSVELRERHPGRTESTLRYTQ